MNALSRFCKTAAHVFLAALLAAPVLAAPPAKKPAAAAQPVAPAAAPASPAKPALGPIASFAAQSGVRQCLGRIDQVSNFLTHGATSGAAVFLPPREPDRGLASVSLEVQGGNGISYVNTVYAPSATGCDGVYEAVTYWAGSCEQVAATFSGFTPANPLRQHIQTLDGGANAKVYLMPAGQGCISIKKEVIY